MLFLQVGASESTGSEGYDVVIPFTGRLPFQRPQDEKKYIMIRRATQSLNGLNQELRVRRKENILFLECSP